MWRENVAILKSGLLIHCAHLGVYGSVEQMVCKIDIDLSSNLANSFTFAPSKFGIIRIRKGQLSSAGLSAVRREEKTERLIPVVQKRRLASPRGNLE